MSFKEHVISSVLISRKFHIFFPLLSSHFYGVQVLIILKTLI